MSLQNILKTKGLTVRQMDEPIRVGVAVIEEKVEAVLEDKKDEIHEKAEEVAKKVDEVADKAAEKVEQAAESVISKVEEVIPGGAKAVEIIDAALVGVGFSCGCLGWKFSVEKLARKTSK